MLAASLTVLVLTFDNIAHVKVEASTSAKKIELLDNITVRE